ncbi:hypothetical protein ACFLYO_02245 [Chloroflexota bacterium]
MTQDMLSINPADLLRANNQIDAAALRPVARLGGVFTMDRPQITRS